MNLRNVLTAYSKLRNLTDDETALLETLRGLNEAERDLLIVALQPEKPAGKKASKKASSKSSRASGMAAAISRSLDRQGPTAANSDQKCSYQYPYDSAVNPGLPCKRDANDGVHDERMGYAGYHEFQASPAEKVHGAGGD